MEKLGSLLSKETARTGSDEKFQSTRHQQDAAETAEMLGDLKSIGIYLSIFKRYSSRRDDLIRCRAWVLSLQSDADRGRLFVASYRKFINRSPNDGQRDHYGHQKNNH